MKPYKSGDLLTHSGMPLNPTSLSRRRTPCPDPTVFSLPSIPHPGYPHQYWHPLCATPPSKDIRFPNLFLSFWMPLNPDLFLTVTLLLLIGKREPLLLTILKPTLVSWEKCPRPFRSYEREKFFLIGERGEDTIFTTTLSVVEEEWKKTSPFTSKVQMKRNPSLP